jgi:hypothetical protein
VNGSALIASSLRVGQNLAVGDGLLIGTDFISYQPAATTDEPNNFTFSIQPAGMGKISLLAGLMQLDASGFVAITGDLKVAGAVTVDEELRTGSLLSNLIRPSQAGADIQIKLAELDETNQTTIESKLELVGAHEQAVASFSAQGDLSLTGALRLQSTSTIASDSGELVAEQAASAGRATLAAGNTEVIIANKHVGLNSMIYVTPLGSTNNQVIYLKHKVADDPNTLTNEGQFGVGIDFPLGQDLEFNWWIVQLD